MDFGIGYLYKAFVEPWQVVVVSIQAGGDSATAGAILAIILVGLWAFMFWMLKLIIWNVVFPKIRLIDQFGNRVKTARVYLRARQFHIDPDVALSANKDYYYGKFKLFPILIFHRICIDRSRFRTRRMPWYHDVFTSGMNLRWDTHEEGYVIDDGQLSSVFDDTSPYQEHALTDIKTVGTLVVEGVKGDFELIKKKFKLGLAVKRLKEVTGEDHDKK